MQIFTSSWHGYRGPGRIGISRGVPRFNVPAGYKLYRTLAPSRSILHETKGINDYRARFFAEILSPLDPHAVLSDLTRLAGDHPPVMLCFEKPPFNDANFCHRHMVSDWLNAIPGVTCEEWSGCTESNRERQTGRLL
jgi:hypothetical protein